MKTIANILCVLNEAEYIGAALTSILPGCAQIIVIDQGSTDGTQDILEDFQQHYGEVVWISSRGQTFLNRGEQFFRNLAIDLCFCDWMMVTDGDEIMSPGWEKIVHDFLEKDGDNFGAIRGSYWQMIGTSGYHTVNSPLPYEAGERPLFYRNCESIHAGDPMQGTKVHVAFVGIDPSPVQRLPIDCFHLGYAKSDLTGRFNRNIERGDWTQKPELKKEFYAQSEKDPLALLWECVPVSEDIKKRMPDSIRHPKFECEYDDVRRRITARKPISFSPRAA